MQRFETYGFIMDFDEKNYDKYMELKTSIECLCKESLSFAKLYHRNDLIQYFPLRGKNYITCAVINNHAEFGLYSRQYPNTILQHLPEYLTEYLSVQKIQALKDTMEITAQNDDRLKISPIQELWVELYKEKGLTEEHDHEGPQF